MVKNKPNRPLNQSFQQGCARLRYTTFDNISAGAVELLIPHPMAGRPWRVVGPTDVPGFCHLEFSFSLGRNCEESRVEYTICTLCLPEEQFRRFSSFKPSFPQDW